MSKIRMMIGVSAFASLATAGAASASSVNWIAPTSYSTSSDSPFATGPSSGSSTSLWLEDFEDGVMNSLGLSATGGSVRGPQNSTDSIDGDGNGVIDGMGNTGYSFLTSSGISSLTFTFNAAALGGLPTMAGLVWTDGNSSATVRFEVFDANGQSAGVFNAGALGDGGPQGSTAEDRFIGARFDDGISAIRIFATAGGIEVDHVQYGFSSAVVPLPAPVAMGLAGLGLVGIARRRRRNAA